MTRFRFLVFLGSVFLGGIPGCGPAFLVPPESGTRESGPQDQNGQASDAKSRSVGQDLRQEQSKSELTFWIRLVCRTESQVDVEPWFDEKVLANGNLRDQWRGWGTLRNPVNFRIDPKTKTRMGHVSFQGIERANDCHFLIERKFENREIVGLTYLHLMIHASGQKETHWKIDQTPLCRAQSHYWSIPLKDLINKSEEQIKGLNQELQLTLDTQGTGSALKTSIELRFSVNSLSG